MTDELSYDVQLALLNMISTQITHYEQVLTIAGSKHFYDEDSPRVVKPYLGEGVIHSEEMRVSIFNNEYPHFMELLESLQENYFEVDWDEIMERAEAIAEDYHPKIPFSLATLRKLADERDSNKEDS